MKIGLGCVVATGDKLLGGTICQQAFDLGTIRIEFAFPRSGRSAKFHSLGLLEAPAQEGVVITYPTASELAASTLAYAVAKKRYFSELRSALPILIAIGLKERPETAEVEEFRSAFRLLDWEEERRIAKATAEILKGFENDQAVAAAEKEFNEAQEIEAAFDRDFDGLDAT